MNDVFSEMFRSMFGFGRRDRFPSDHDRLPDDDSHHADGFPGGGFPGNGQFFFFSHPLFGGENHKQPADSDGSRSDTHPFGSGIADVFGQFQEIFERLAIGDILPNGNGVYSLEPPADGASIGGDNPREEMLKQPDNSPAKSPHIFGERFGSTRMNRDATPHKDSDLDEDIRRGNLDALFGHRGNTPYQNGCHPGTVAPHPGAVDPGHGALQTGTQRIHTYKSVSVSTYRNADGQIEERRTIQDARGNKETSISRVIDGQRHSVTTRRDHTGTEHVTEDFINMDQNDKELFDSRWNSKKLPENGRYGNVIQPDAETRTIFKNLFGRGFPGFGGEDS